MKGVNNYMDIEEKKGFLRSYLEGKKELDSIVESIEALRMSKMLPSINMDGMPHAHNTSDLSGYVAKLDELERKIQAKQWQIINIQMQIEISIMEMKSSKERMVLRYRYIQGLKWEEICLKMGYSWQNTHLIHAKALKNFKMPEKLD